MFCGKNKAITFSYDDGVEQDIRLIEIFDKYNLKATFNINSGHLGAYNIIEREGKTINHKRFKAEELSDIYKNHEIAAHTISHNLLTELSESEIIREVEEDRKKLEEITGRSVVGMAYPCGGVNYDERVVKIIKENTNIKYARTTISAENYEPQSELIAFKPTVYHHGEWNRMIELGKEFIKLQTETPKLLYIWGHAYEFDINDKWSEFEEFCAMISNHEDIFYGTNREVFGF